MTEVHSLGKSTEDNSIEDKSNYFTNAAKIGYTKREQVIENDTQEILTDIDNIYLCNHKKWITELETGKNLHFYRTLPLEYKPNFYDLDHLAYIVNFLVEEQADNLKKDYGCTFSVKNEKSQLFVEFKLCN